jgi:release factor glutamine methyltransferase
MTTVGGGKMEQEGTDSFLGVALQSGPGVFRPRAETELLGRLGVAFAQAVASQEGSVRVVDIGCGAGNLTCAIASAVEGAEVYACDVLPAATALTARNAERLDIADRVRVLTGDGFAPLAGLEGTVDLVVSNPPYISTGRLDRDRGELLVGEPREAFDGGPYGISMLQRLVRDALVFLKDDGALALEVGAGQATLVKTLFERSGGYLAPEALLDDEGAERVVFGLKASVGGAARDLQSLLAAAG